MRRFAMLWGFAWGAACGEASKDAPTPVEFEDYCAQLAATLCEAAESCCQGYKDCLRVEAEHCSGLFTSDGASASEPAGYDREKAGAVLTEVGVRAKQCDDFYYPKPYELGVGASPAIPGDGEACPSGQRCAEGLYCTFYEMGSEPPVCAPLPLVGELCTGNGKYAGIPCAEDLVCVDIDPTTYQGVCETQHKDGQSCKHDEECVSTFCDDGVICRPLSDSQRGSRWCSSLRGNSQVLQTGQPI